MPRAGNRRVRFVSVNKQQERKQTSAMGKASSRVAVSDAGKKEQQVPPIPASIADDLQRPSPKSSPVAEQPELTEVYEDTASRSISTSATGPPALDPFTSVGTPGDLTLLPSLVEVTHQIVYNNKPSITAPRSSLHGRVVELFGGRRMISALTHRRAQSEEVPQRPEHSTRHSRGQPSPSRVQSLTMPSMVRDLYNGMGESVVVESFTPPNFPQVPQFVDRQTRQSRDSDIHSAQPLAFTPFPASDDLENDVFAPQHVAADLSPVRPAERIERPNPVALPKRQNAEQTSRNTHCRPLSFKKQPVRPAGVMPAEPTGPCVFPGMPGHLHEGMPAYYEWLREHEYLDEDYKFLPVQQATRSISFVQPAALLGPVEILPAPAHELNGFAAVAKDIFAPQIVIRGFETPYSAPHPIKLKSKVKVGTDKLFVVPLECSREHGNAVHNHVACVMPPPRSTFVWLDGADDSDSDEGLFLQLVARSHSRSQSMSSELDGADEENEQDPAPRVSPIPTISLQRTISVHGRRGGSVSFAEDPQVFGGAIALDDSPFLSRPRSATASGIATAPHLDRHRAPTFSIDPSSRRPSLSAIAEDAQSVAPKQLHLCGYGTVSTSQSTASSVQYGPAVILQDGRNTVWPAAEKKSEEYKRTWGEFKDVNDKFHADLAMERMKQSRRVPQLVALTDAEPPSPNSPMAVRRPASPTKLSQRASNSLNVDTRAIFLTPVEEIPRYPQPGSAAYFDLLAQRPLFVFFSDGYIKRSKVTDRMIELFENSSTAPDWASEIPDIKAQRATKEVTSRGLFGTNKVRFKPSDIDLSTDRFVMYWETLIVRADILRGCELAKEAAKQLVRKRG